MHKSRRMVRVLRVGGVLLGAATVAWLAVPALAAPANKGSASPPAAAQQTQTQDQAQSPASSSGSVTPDATTNNNGNGVCTNDPNNNPNGYPVCKKCPPGWSGPDQNGNCNNPCPPGYRPTGHKNPPDCRPPKNPNQYCQAQYGNGWHFDKKSGDCVQDHKDSAGGPPPGTCYKGKVPFSGRCVPPNKACQLGYPTSHGAHYVKADKNHPTAGCYAGNTYLGPLPSGPPSP